MCLAIPMKIIERIDDVTATAEVDGTRYRVNLQLVGDVALGEHVIVHAGFAIEKLDEAEAEERMKLFAEIANARATDA